MFKCPYCYAQIAQNVTRCPSCLQFIVDEIINVDFPSVDKKNCLFCGKKILKEAKFCRYCRHWLDEIDKAADEIDPEDLV